LYAAELARRHPSITSVSVHPGVVGTNLVGDLSAGQKAFVYMSNLLVGRTLLAPERGSHSQLWCAAGGEKTKMVNGGYYMPIGVLSNDKLDSTAKDPKLAQGLWEWTDNVLAEY
jgi:hypothetical protein